ncbi:2-aminoethylphosphonate ABC transporter substrate-binding protein, partial [Streptomyces albidoflavus]
PNAVALSRLMESVEIFTPDWAAVGENLDRHVDAWKSATGS